MDPKAMEFSGHFLRTSPDVDISKPSNYSERINLPDGTRIYSDKLKILGERQPDNVVMSRNDIRHTLLADLLWFPHGGHACKVLEHDLNCQFGVSAVHSSDVGLQFGPNDGARAADQRQLLFQNGKLARFARALT